MKFSSFGFIFIAALLTSCSEPTPQPDEFIGSRESHSFRMNIGRNGDAYLVDPDNYRGTFSGEYAGELIDDGMKLTLTLAGEQLILMSESGDRLTFIGEQLEKVQPWQSREKSERRE